MLRTQGRLRGFTLIEIVVTLALVALLAMVAVPVYDVAATRAKEAELHTALRQIRTALDHYKVAVDDGLVSRVPAGSGYPSSLAVLVDGVDTVQAAIGSPLTPTGGIRGMVVSAQNAPSRMVFLRQIPRDPFFPDQSVDPAQQWNLRSYGALPGEFNTGEDVYDVKSKSTAIGLNGVSYKDW